MVNIKSNSNKVAYGIKHFNIDELSDLINIDKERLVPGSTVFIINTSKYYMLNGKHKWIEIKPFCNASSSSSDNGNSDSDDSTSGGNGNDYIYDGGSIDGSDPV